MNINVLKNSIINVIQYKFNSNEGNVIHIGYGVDNNYVRCMATSIASFCINNKEKNLVFHVIASAFSEENKNKLKILAKQYMINIMIYEVDINYFKSLPIMTNNITVATYFRFILPLVLKDVEKLFYIDADIVCLKNASDLFNINLDGKIIAAVPDLEKMNKRRNKVLNLKEHIYFNAGVMIIDINKWNKYEVLNKAIAVINKNSKLFIYQDQDILNKILSGKIKYISKAFNCIDVYDFKQNEIVLLHFANHPKPWNKYWYLNIIYNNFTKDLYNFYEKNTPWCNSLLENNVTMGNYVKYVLKLILYKLKINI